MFTSATTTESETLSGLALAYALLKAEGASILGNRTGPFVCFNEESNSLTILGGNSNNVTFASFEKELVPAALKEAQALGASLIVHGSEVICHIEGFSASGSSYGEAALRMLHAYFEAKPR